METIVPIAIPFTLELVEKWNKPLTAQYKYQNNMSLCLYTAHIYSKGCIIPIEHTDIHT